jgi:hypothetical protein
MYAYYTLTVIAIIYIIFAVSSLRNGKWYYLFIHPFALICFDLTLKYRYASDIPGLAVTVDQMIAVGVVLASLMFAASYFLIKEKQIEKFNNLFFVNKKSEMDGISNRKRVFYIVFIPVTIICYFTVMYWLYGSFEAVFFGNYANKGIILPTNLQAGLLERTLRLITSSLCCWILPFISFTLLFETLYKKRSYNYLLITILFILTLIMMTVSFSMGYRSFTAYFVFCILLFIIFSYIHKLGLRKIAIPLIILLILYSAVCFLTLGFLRGNSLQKGFNAVVTLWTHPKLINDSLQENLLVDKKNDKNLQLLNDLQEQQVKDTTSIIIQNRKNNLSSKKHDKETEKEKEKNMLLSLPPYGHRVSKEIGWIVAYFGKHEPYAGILCELRGFMNHLLPPPLGKDRSYQSPSKKLDELRRGNAEGPFGHGYISYGLTGAYLYWAGYAFLCGILAKFSIINLFICKKIYLENIAISIALIIILPSVFCSGNAFLCNIIHGSIFILISIAILNRLLPQKNCDGI